VLGPVHRFVGKGIEGIPGGHRVQQRPVDVNDPGRGRVPLGSQDVRGGGRRVRHPDDHRACPVRDVPEPPIGAPVRCAATVEIDVGSQQPANAGPSGPLRVGRGRSGRVEEPAERGPERPGIGRIRHPRVRRGPMRGGAVRRLDLPAALLESRGLEQMMRIQIFDDPIEVRAGEDLPAGEAGVLGLHVQRFPAAVEKQRDQEYRKREQHRRREQSLVVAGEHRLPPIPLRRHKI